MIPEFDAAALYDAGCYRVPRPPVAAGGWGRDAWIAYITGAGGWFCYALRTSGPGGEQPLNDERWLDRSEAAARAEQLMRELGHPIDVITVPAQARDPITA